MPPNAVPPPDLKIPSSQSTVDVSIIDTTTRIWNVPTSLFLTPSYASFPTLNCPAYSFLIRHESTSTNLIFDLGLRKDYENMPQPILDRLQNGGWGVKVDKNVSEILEENGIKTSEVSAIIWSHHHWDHTGDPSTFPAETSLVVGPNFKSTVGEGFPKQKDSPVSTSAWEGRQLRELSFDQQDSELKIGQYRAIDYFGDGSFYLLDTPGHTVDHICGLARTKSQPPEFIFMGGDIAHHGGEYKPNKHTPLPETIKPDPRGKPRNSGVCPGELSARVNQNGSGWSEPFFKPAEGFAADVEQATWCLDVLGEFDAYDNIFVVFAHDTDLYDVLEFFPEPANDWSRKGWKKDGYWRFLRDLTER